MMLFVYLMFMGLTSFIFNREYLLMMLMSLEYMSVILFFSLYINFFGLEIEMYLMMVYLVFCVCEGVLGLSLLVMIIRCYGNNYISSLSLLKC